MKQQLLGIILLFGFMQNIHADTSLYLVSNPNEGIIPPTTFAIYRLNPEMNKATQIYSRNFRAESYLGASAQQITVLDGVNNVFIHPEKKWALLLGDKSIIDNYYKKSAEDREKTRGWLRIYDFKQEKFVEECILPEGILPLNYFYNTPKEQLAVLITKLETDKFYQYDLASDRLRIVPGADVKWENIVYQDASPFVSSYRRIAFHLNKETGEMYHQTYQYMTPMGFFLSKEILDQHKALTNDGAWMSGHTDSQAWADGSIYAQTDTQAFIALYIWDPAQKIPKRYFVLFDKVKKSWKTLSLDANYFSSGTVRRGDYWVVFPLTGDSKYVDHERAVYRFITSNGEKMSTWTTQPDTEVLLITENDELLFRHKDSLYRCPFIDGKVLEDQKQCCIQADWVYHAHWAIESPTPENPTPKQKTIYPSPADCQWEDDEEENPPCFERTYNVFP